MKRKKQPKNKSKTVNSGPTLIFDELTTSKDAWNVHEHIFGAGIDPRWPANIREDGRIEWQCPHGVGHGSHTHGCDGCCTSED